jgi:hypothetical protein
VRPPDRRPHPHRPAPTLPGRWLAAGSCRKPSAPGSARPHSNLPSLQDILAEADPDALLAACGIAPEAAARLADFYAAPPVATLIGWGLQRHVHGGETVRYIDAACLLSGNVGLPGGGVYYNVSSSRYLADWDTSCPRPAASPAPPPAQPGRRTRPAAPKVAPAWVDGTNVVKPGARRAAMARPSPPSTSASAWTPRQRHRAPRLLVLPPALALSARDVMGPAAPTP